MSLDGFIARSDGRIDWLSVVERSVEDYGYEALRLNRRRRRDAVAS
jgi:hypothetical protein